MDLRGVALRNIYELCNEMNNNSEKAKNLCINIPHYQRPYKWGREQIVNLFKDYIKNKNSSGNEEYFVGSVVAVKKEDGEYYGIIDGQQRLTTVYLLNFVSFLLRRAYIEELLLANKNHKIESQLKKLEVSYTRILGKTKCEEIKHMRKLLMEKIDELNDACSLDKENKEKEILHIYYKAMYLPEKNYNDNNYEKNHKEKMRKFFCSEELNLTYQRENYTKKLKEAMSSFYIRLSNAEGPELKEIGMSEDEARKDDRVLEQYVNAIKYIYEEIKQQVVSEESALKKCEIMLQFIGDMMKAIKFCIIVTGNESDAYTLFEVLNDRALAIEDLDLIKNMFFREYCLHSTKDSEEKKDDNIEKLDRIWGEDIFSSNVGIEKTKLIAYLGTTYLTRDETINPNDGPKYRNIIEEKYIHAKYIKQNKSYEYIDIYNDFRVFHMAKVIVDMFDIKFRKSGRNEMAIKAESDMNKSITYKTIHLLNAFNMEGVISAITNLIMKQFIFERKECGKGEINIGEFREFVRNIINRSSEKDSTYGNITRCSYNLWVSALKSDGYKIPRNIAKRIIKNNCEIDSLSLLAEEQRKLDEQLEGWMEKWNYKEGKLVKVKILFIELFKTKKENNKIIYNVVQNQFGEDSEIHLDHLEADTIDESNSEKYFYPSDLNEDRNKYVQQLGNFMILDSSDNNEKNNKPLFKAIKYYDNMAEHWLIQELKEMIDEEQYCKEIKIKDEVIMVPTEKFFNERKSRIKRYFGAVLSRESVEEKEIQLQYE